MKKPFVIALLINSNNLFVEVTADDPVIKAVVKDVERKT
jgi:hypothetical protein